MPIGNFTVVANTLHGDEITQYVQVRRRKAATLSAPPCFQEALDEALPAIAPELYGIGTSFSVALTDIDEAAE